MIINIKILIASIIATICYILALAIVGFSIYYGNTYDPNTGIVDRPYLHYMWYMWIPLVCAFISHGYAMWPR